MIKLTQKIQICSVFINLKFPCKIFVVINIRLNNMKTHKIHSNTVDLINKQATLNQTFTVDLQEKEQKISYPLELEYVVHVQTKNGVKMAGKVTDCLASELHALEKTLNLEKCPDKQASIKVRYGENTMEKPPENQINIIYDNNIQARIRLLINEKSKLQNKISLLELDNYQKDLIINNLNLELKLKAEENLYLFSADKIKQISLNYQQEIKQAKNKLQDSQIQCRALKKELEMLNTKQNKQQNLLVLEKMLQSLERKIYSYVKQAIIDTQLTSNSRKKESNQQDQQLGNVNTQIHNFQKAINMLNSKYNQSLANCIQLKKQYDRIALQCEEFKKQNKRVLQQLHILNELLKEKQKNLLNLQHLNKDKESKIKEVKVQLKTLQNECEHLKKQAMLKSEQKYQQQILRLKSQLDEYKHNKSQVQRKLETMLIQKNQQIIILRTEFDQILQQKQYCQNQLNILKQQLNHLQNKLEEQQKYYSASTNKSKYCLKQISNTNLNILESYNKLKQQNQYRLNEERMQLTIIKQECDQMRVRYENEIYELKARIRQLQTLEDDTINLCHSLGFEQLENIEGSGLGYDIRQEYKNISLENVRLKKQVQTIQKSLIDLQKMLLEKGY